MSQDKQAKQLSQEERAKQLAEELVQKLQGVTDEETIRLITLEIWDNLQKIAPNENSFRRCRKIFRDIIKSVFPHKLLDDGYSPSIKPSLSYYYTETKEDKKATPRWEHLALWYSTTSKGREDVMGDKARSEYFSQWEDNYSENFKKWKQSVLESELAPETQPETQEIKKLKLEDMTLQHLELDAETQQIVSNALEHSGMPLADFVRQACRIYAKTVTGKAKQSEDDLSPVPTERLLNASHVVDGREFRTKYYTHPNRAEELTKRAITAIQRHNINAPEKDQRWMITQTAIQALTGSRPAAIKKILEKYKTMIDDHNKNYELDAYSNRKGGDRKIEDEINLTQLVPDGLDL